MAFPRRSNYRRRVCSDKEIRYEVVTLGILVPCLLLHAWRYHFFCDDGLIALRYARNLVEHRELVYNVGERVEGFTSPLWVLLVSLGRLIGGDLVTVSRLLGGLSAVGTFAALCLFWR